MQEFKHNFYAVTINDKPCSVIDSPQIFKCNFGETKTIQP